MRPAPPQAVGAGVVEAVPLDGGAVAATPLRNPAESNINRVKHRLELELKHDVDIGVTDPLKDRTKDRIPAYL